MLWRSPDPPEPKECRVSEFIMDRKSFLKSAGTFCVGSCLCVAGLHKALAQDSTDVKPGAATPERAVKRMEFADGWIRRFMGALDGTLDPAARKKVMMANGKSCFSEWIQSQGGVRSVAFDAWADRVREHPPADGSVRVEGHTIYFEYTSSAETGQDSPEGVCLCPMVESKPTGLSPTYCLCSVGYVKEMHEQRFGRRCDVELLDSVLRGGQRCRFKITVA
jgi:hypothetical protein